MMQCIMVKVWQVPTRCLWRHVEKHFKTLRCRVKVARGSILTKNTSIWWIFMQESLYFVHHFFLCRGKTIKWGNTLEYIMQWGTLIFGIDLNNCCQLFSFNIMSRHKPHIYEVTVLPDISLIFCPSVCVFVTCLWIIYLF